MGRRMTKRSTDGRKIPSQLRADAATASAKRCEKVGKAILKARWLVIQAVTDGLGA